MQLQIETLRGLSNVYLIKYKAAGILVDAGVSVAVLKQHLKNIKIAGILLTHGHYDHMYNLKEILEYIKQNNNPNCKCYLHKNAVKKLYDPVSNCSIFFDKQFISGADKNDLVEIKEGSLTLPEFDVPIDVIETLGHTNCSVTYKIDGVLFTGDTIFNGAVGRTDCPTGDYNALVKSIDNLYAKYKGFTFYAGHGSKGTL